MVKFFITFLCVGMFVKTGMSQSSGTIAWVEIILEYVIQFKIE